MRILVVSQYFWPENFRVNDLCEELVKRGHSVTVLTGLPNYPSGKIFKEFQFNKKAFSNHNGISIIRAPIVPRGKSKISLLFNYMSFMLSASTFGLFKIRKQQYDVIYLHQLSPIFSVVPGVLLGIYKKIPIVIWILDLWPDSLNIIGLKNRKIHSFVNVFANFIYKNCNSILIQSRAFYSEVKKHGIDKERIHYFPNWAESIFRCTSNKSNLISSDGFSILFAGNIGEAQNFTKLLTGLRLAKDIGAEFTFYVAGDGRWMPHAKQKVNDEKLNKHVIFLGSHPLDMMPRLYASVDVLLLSLKEGKHFSQTIPGKLQTYLASGKPVIGLISGEGNRVIKDAQCGYVSEANDLKGFARNLLLMSKLSDEELTQLGQKSLEYSKKNFNRDLLISKFESILSKSAYETK